jgi:hypothetical protein
MIAQLLLQEKKIRKREVSISTANVVFESAAAAGSL